MAGGHSEGGKKIKDIAVRISLVSNLLSTNSVSLQRGHSATRSNWSKEKHFVPSISPGHHFFTFSAVHVERTKTPRSKRLQDPVAQFEAQKGVCCGLVYSYSTLNSALPVSAKVEFPPEAATNSPFKTLSNKMDKLMTLPFLSSKPLNQIPPSLQLHNSLRLKKNIQKQPNGKLKKVNNTT